MPVLRGLNEEETRTLFHLIRNRQTEDTELLGHMMSNEDEARLSKISEEENFNAKNRYRL